MIPHRRRRPSPSLLLALAPLVASAALAASPDPLKLSDADVAKWKSLSKETMEKYKAKDWEGAAAAFKAQSAIYDRSDDALYNYTCVLSLARRKPEALDALGRAVEEGFLDVDHMRGDSDLDAIRLDPRFDKIMARAEELAKVPAVDPFATKGAAPARTPGTIEELRSHVAEGTKAYARVRPILGSTHAREIRTSMARDEVAAYEAFAAAHPEAAEACAYGAIDAMSRFPEPSATLVKAIDAFVKAHPGSPHAVQVRFAKAKADAAVIEVVDAESDRKHDMVLMEAARAIVADAPGLAEKGAGAEADEEREIVFWAYRDARVRGDDTEARRLYGILKKRWGSDEAFWEENSYEFFEEKIADGLPAFSVKSIGGETMSLDAARGKVTLLDFWATWCGPCVKEVPHLVEAYEKFHEKGFEIYGISADRPEDTKVADLKAWIDEKGMAWPQYYDDKEDTSKLVLLFGIEGFPTTILIDREGKVVAVNLRGKELIEKVGSLVGKGPAS